MASNAKALSFLSGDLSLSGTEVSINVAGSVQSDSITGSTITMKNTGSTIVASDGTTAVLSESGGTVTLTADEANVGSNALVVDSSGNVGVGTSSPSSRLHVSTGSSGVTANSESKLVIENSNTAAIAILSPETNESVIYFGSPTSNLDGGIIYNHPNRALAFRTSGNTERMRIDSSGNVGVGPSSLASLWKGNLNIVQPSGTKTELYFLRDTQVEAHMGFLGSNTNSNFYVGTGPALSNYGMYQQNQGMSWVSVSDERQKTNLIPIVDAINKIKQLRTVTGRFITDEEGVSRSFLIAQDFVNNFPEAVDTSNPEKYGLAYTDVIPLIVAGFKEQQTLIESQQSQIDALTVKTQEQDFTIASLISRIEALENA